MHFLCYNLRSPRGYDGCMEWRDNLYKDDDEECGTDKYIDGVQIKTMLVTGLASAMVYRV